MVGSVTGEAEVTNATLLGEPLPVELMNTVSVVDSATRDYLADDDGIAAWLRAVADRIAGETGTRPRPGANASAQPVRPLRELRDALRRLAVEATADPRPPATAPDLTLTQAVSTLNALAQARPELSWPAGGLPARSYQTYGSAGLAVALIAVQGVELFTGPARELLRPCLAPNCLLFFAKDHGRREWCSPACGNRARVARHYRRHHRGM
jgi:predicted RNA-binding Zn ribbon-like protein